MGAVRGLGSGANLAVELLDESPLVPVVVRYNPAICGPEVAHCPLPRGARGHGQRGQTPPQLIPQRSVAPMYQKALPLVQEVYASHDL